MAYFLVTETQGPTWDPTRPRRAQHAFEQHAAFMDALVERGTVLLGGPLGDDVDTGDALLVVAAEDKADVLAILADDPWRDTILSIKRVERWSLWLRAASLR